MCFDSSDMITGGFIAGHNYFTFNASHVSCIPFTIIINSSFTNTRVRYRTDMYIEQAQIKLGYPTSKDIICNDVLNHFPSYKEYKKARDIYWKYYPYFQLSPLSKEEPDFWTDEDEIMWKKFRQLMLFKFPNKVLIKYENTTTRTA